jgi:hypothetical protein
LQLAKLQQAYSLQKPKPVLILGECGYSLFAEPGSVRTYAKLVNAVHNPASETTEFTVLSVTDLDARRFIA